MHGYAMTEEVDWMLLSTQTDVLARTFGHEEALRMLKRVGYDACDLSFFEMVTGEGPWLKDDWKEKAYALRAVADEIGLKVDQAHAPFPSSKGAEPFDTEVRARIIRSMEVASILGVENIIVHPMQHLEFRTHKQELFDMNMDFYRSLIPECERLNIHVCAENMWQHDKRRGYIVDSTCSQPDEFVQYIDTIDSPWIRACLDIGHTALVGLEPEEAIYALGHDRLKALHVHDVDYLKDCHTMPYMEKIHWDKVTKALADIDYDGVFTFEADNFLVHMPDEVKEDGARLMVSVGRYLIGEIEKAKEENAK